MSHIPPQVVWKLQKAEGALLLQMSPKAAALLAEIPQELQESAPYLECKMELGRQTGDWTAMADAARKLVEQKPAEAGYRIQWAFATRRAHSLPEAEKILLTILADFKEAPSLVHYNLACYAAVQGDLKAAWNYFLKAVREDAHWLEMGLEDDDLFSLRDQIMDRISQTSS